MVPIAASENHVRTHTCYGAAMQYAEPVLWGLVAGRYGARGTDGVLFMDGEFEVHGAGAGGSYAELFALQARAYV